MELNFESKKQIQNRRQKTAATRQAASSRQKSLFDERPMTNEEFNRIWEDTKPLTHEQIKSFGKWLRSGKTNFDDKDHLNALDLDF